MTTHIAHRGFGFDAMRAMLQPQPQRAPLAAATANASSQAGWIDRLAIWAERQPMHHRLGSYTRLR